MRVTWKFVGFTTAVIVLATSALIWRNQTFLIERRTADSRASLEAQAQLIGSVVSHQTEFMINQMTQFVYVRGSGRALNASAQQILSRFDAIALLTVNDGRNWSSRWVEKNARTVQSRFPDGFLSSLFATLPISRLEPGQPTWVLVQDAKKRPALALLNFVQLSNSESASGAPALMIGLVNPSYLSDSVKAFAGTAALAALVDSRGAVLAHSDSQWVGQNLGDSQLITAALAQKGSTFFKTIKEVGGSEKFLASSPAAHTNLQAILAVPVSQAGTQLPSLQLVILSFGILIVAGFSSYYLAQGLETEPTQQSAPATPAVVTPKPAPLAQVSEKDVFRRFSAAISAELKMPVVALLGHIQVMTNKAASDEERGQAKMLDKEARKVKRVFDALSHFAGLDNSASSKDVHLPDVVEDILKRLSPQLESVRVHKQLNHVPHVHASKRQVEIICEELILNAVQAMSTSPERNLSVIVEPNGAGVRLRVKDSGPGISPQMRAKMFEPFSSDQNKLGLGLSVVRNLLLDQGGHISVQSEGVGAELTVDFLPDAAIPKLAKARHLAPQENKEVFKNITLETKRSKKTRVESTVDEEAIPLTDEKLLFAKSESSLVIPTKLSNEDFRVKIRRPKLKVDN